MKINKSLNKVYLMDKIREFVAKYYLLQTAVYFYKDSNNSSVISML